MAAMFIGNLFCKNYKRKFTENEKDKLIWFSFFSVLLLSFLITSILLSLAYLFDPTTLSTMWDTFFSTRNLPILIGITILVLAMHYAAIHFGYKVGASQAIKKQKEKAH